MRDRASGADPRSASTRYEIVIEIAACGETRNLNDPHSGCGGDLDVAHVDDYTHRGYVRNRGRAGLVLRWSDSDLTETGRHQRIE
jgi:hypothetical protein